MSLDWTGSGPQTKFLTGTNVTAPGLSGNQLYGKAKKRIAAIESMKKMKAGAQLPNPGTYKLGGNKF